MRRTAAAQTAVLVTVVVPPAVPAHVEAAQEESGATGRGVSPGKKSGELRQTTCQRASVVPAQLGFATDEPARQARSSNARSAVKRFCVPGAGGGAGISDGWFSSVRYALTCDRRSLCAPSPRSTVTRRPSTGAPPECQFAISVSSIR